MEANGDVQESITKECNPSNGEKLQVVPKVFHFVYQIVEIRRIW